MTEFKWTPWPPLPWCLLPLVGIVLVAATVLAWPGDPDRVRVLESGLAAAERRIEELEGELAEASADARMSEIAASLASMNAALRRLSADAATADRVRLQRALRTPGPEARRLIRRYLPAGNATFGSLAPPASRLPIAPQHQAKEESR